MNSLKNDSDGMVLEPWSGKAILLVDLDAFFASVEQLDHPEWRGLPVIVGGDADKRGVVSTCSYEARKFGVRSAMPSSTAKRLCPQAIWTNGNFHRYRELSREIMRIIEDETPHVQQVSIDEAFADITPTRINKEHPVVVANRIRRRVSDIGITCSIGLGTSKSVAKIASDMDKPNGLSVVYPGCEKRFLQDLPINVVSGIGPVATDRLNAKGIETLSDLSAASHSLLESVFGKNAELMRSRAEGLDVSPVEDVSPVKSISHEMSFAEDITERKDAEAVISTLLTKVGRRLRSKGLKGSTLTLKVRFDNRAIQNAQLQVHSPCDDELEMFPYFLDLLDRIWFCGIRLRLIGVAVSGFEKHEQGQATLFDVDEVLESEKGASNIKPLVEDAGKRRGLIEATDVLKDKFGEDVVVFGSALRNADNTTGSSSKNPADYK